MASGYIRLDKDQVADPRLFDIADRLAKQWRFTPLEGQAAPLSDNDNCHALRHALLGVTVTLWSHLDTHINSDNSLHVTLPALAAILCVPVTLLQALPKEWLHVRADGYLEFPKYCEKNHIVARDLRRDARNEQLEGRRESDRLRQQRRREKLKSDRHAVTAPEMSRDSVTVTPSTGPGPGSLRPNPGPKGKRAANSEGSHDRLASAQGHLAGRLNGGKPPGPAPATKSTAELEADIRTLSQTGLDSEAIAKVLGQHGVTPGQVAAVLSNRPTQVPS